MFAMCCSAACFRVCCPCFVNAGFNYNYSVQQNYTAQLMDLPLVDSIIGATAYRYTDRAFSGSANAAGTGVGGGCTLTCCHCTNIAQFCCNILCWPFTVCCACCKCGFQRVDLTDSFSFQEKHIIGIPEPSEKAGTIVSENIKWNMSLTGQEEIALDLLYLSPLNGRARSMKMVVSNKGSAFEDTQRFVANIGSHRVTTSQFKHPFLLVQPLPGFSYGNGTSIFQLC